MKIAPDKWKHFYVGLVMGALLQAFFAFLLDEQVILAVLFSVLVSTFIGYGFELFSKFSGKGHYDVMDAVATLAGALPAIVLVAFIQYF